VIDSTLGLTSSRGFVSNMPAATALDQTSFPALVRIKKWTSHPGSQPSRSRCRRGWRHSLGRRGSRYVRYGLSLRVYIEK